MTQALMRTAYELVDCACSYTRMLGKPAIEEPPEDLVSEQEVLAIPLQDYLVADSRVPSYWGSIRDLEERFKDDTLYLDISKISLGALAEFLIDYHAPPHVLASALLSLEQLRDGNYNAASIQEEEEEDDGNKMRGMWKNSQTSAGEMESRDTIFPEKMSQSLEFKPARKRTVREFFSRFKWKLNHSTHDTNPAEGEGSEEEEGERPSKFSPVRLFDNLRIYWYRRTHRKKPVPKAEVYTSESVTSVRKDIKRVPSLWSRTMSYVRLSRPVEFFYANIYWL